MNYQSILKRQTSIILISVIFMVLIIIGVSYSLFMQVDESKDIQVLESGTLVLSSTKGTTITSSTVPQSDYDGMNTEGYTFSIKNTGTLDCDYTLYISNVAFNPVNSEYIRISVNNGNPITIADLDIDSENPTRFILELGYLSPVNQEEDVVTYNIKVWIDELAPASIIGKNIQLQLDLYGETYELQNPSEPELYAGLIPIIYDENTNIVIANANEEWYDYDNFEWANAILIDQSNSAIKNKYISSDGTFKSGTIVDMADILQMYVWIPRYRYQLFNTNGEDTEVQMIRVQFEDNTIPKSKGTQNGQWLTHPAFTFGDTELNGIWVGKFESSGSSDNLTIIPNVQSLRNINVSTMFNVSRAIETTAKYGLSASEVDTHMMKNMEWGAVVYLSQSEYGKYGNPNYTDTNKGIYENNSDGFYTGRSGGSTNPRTSELGTYEYNALVGTYYEKVSGENNISVNSTFTNDQTYPWKLVDGIYKTTTDDFTFDMPFHSNELKFTFTMTNFGEVSFDFAAIGQTILSFDILKDGNSIQLTPGTIALMSGSENYGKTEDELTYISVLEPTLSPGTYEIIFTFSCQYNKRFGGGYIKNFSIKYGANYIQKTDNESNGVGASTTGTIYGIYDMSGGANEYVMGNIVTKDGFFNFSDSDFTFLPEPKYYDSYAYGTSYKDYSREHLGDATKETQGWNYTNEFGTWSDPWFIRGGFDWTFGNGGGVFAFTSNDGDVSSALSWRVVLSSE